MLGTALSNIFLLPNYLFFMQVTNKYFLKKIPILPPAHVHDN